MKYIITYDISKSKYRKMTSDFLISEGFIRVQKSVFIGNSNPKYIKKLENKINYFLDEITDSVIFCPICMTSLEKSVFIGITFDLDDLEKFKEFIFFI